MKTEKTGFTEQFEEKVKDTVKKYDLVQKNDKVIVACSGGKDSTTTLYLLKKFGYDVEALIIDLLIGKWSEDNLENVKKFCKKLGVKLHVINMRHEFGCSICYIRSGIQSKERLGNCSICGVIKRWLLNKKARELGAMKLATGHNLDDEAETVLMTLFKGKPEIMLGAGPKTMGIKDEKFIPRIKPLYFCTNAEVARYSKAMNFPVLYDPCPCSVGTYRRRIRKWLAELAKRDSDIKENLVNNFLQLLPVLRESRKPGKKIRYCRNCKEPSRNEICKRCELIKIIFG
jgi:uncharacterized protein (TIGR00269 family)